MSENQLFQKLLPININFVNGESPSSTKMTGIFNYIQASYFILESYMGNGIDYGVSTLANRKMMFNIASTIGSSGNIYRPTNKFGSLYSLHKFFSAVNQDSGAQVDSLHAEHTNYVVGDEVTGEYLEITEAVNVPINIEDRESSGHQLGVIYKGKGTIIVHSGTGAQSTLTCNPPVQDELVEAKLSTSANFIDHIKLLPHSDGTPLNIKSIWLVSNSEGILADDATGAAVGEEFIYNVGNAVPVDNGLENEEAFWKIGPPCEHSLSTAQVKCDLRTCGYCLGNTYDIFVDQTGVTGWNPAGQPICGGDVGIGGGFNVQGTVVASKVPANSLKYTPVVYATTSESIIYALQSCLLMKSKPWMAKYRPFAAHKNINAQVILTKNESALYDMNATYNPIKYNVTLRSAGRPDILYVHDVNKELVANSYDKVNVIGGTYSITEMLHDVLEIMAEKQKPQPAVYAD